VHPPSYSLKLYFDHFAFLQLHLHTAKDIHLTIPLINILIKNIIILLCEVNVVCFCSIKVTIFHNKNKFKETSFPLKK